jgi:hypothetical protein
MELIKKDDRWDLYNKDGHKIASTLDGCVNKLSLKNCQAIENGYDLDELADEYCNKIPGTLYEQEIFKEGFQKALEILGDKKFSEEQMKQAYFKGDYDALYDGAYSEKENKFIQSLQQTEWEVSCNPDVKDADGNLILKRK